MQTYRTHALLAGVLYILGTVSGVIALALAGSLVTGDDVLTRIATDQTRLVLGAFFILVMGFSLAAMPLLLYPLFKKESHVLALGMVLFRGPLEGTTYILSALCWLALGALGQEFAAGPADATALESMAQVVIQVGDRIGDILTFTFGIGAVFLYTLFYRTKLIPRWLAVWGLVGVVPYVTVNLLKFFGFNLGLEILYLPLAIQEMVMGLSLIFKGFRLEAVTQLEKKAN